jgi:8-oxo-dGTP pyrophosphatase MutT (NUDIX family)
MLVRDGERLEVLMVERHGGMLFGPGALVFPGGKLDPQDLDPAWSAYTLGGPHDAQSRGLRICALRETFEETGLLLAPVQGEVAARAAALRLKAISGETPFLEVVASLALKLDLDALTPFARWITPLGQPIRFDATFYLARAPEGQTALCDGRETVAAAWMSPEQALALAADDSRKLMRPTRANLALLGQEASVAAALTSARARAIETILQPD